jgi:hypothetical protein
LGSLLPLRAWSQNPALRSWPVLLFLRWSAFRYALVIFGPAPDPAGPQSPAAGAKKPWWE